MEADDLLPNDGTWVPGREPSEQAIGRKKEKARTLEALPVLQEIVEHLEEHINELNSVTTMPDDIKTDPTKFMNAHNAREIAITYLVSEKEYITSLIETNAKNL